MKKIVIVACQKIRDQNLCPADAKCLVAIKRKEGEFARYKEEGAELVAIVNCGECPGTRVIPSLALVKMQLSALNETVDVIHLGTCIAKFCPYKEDILKALKEKAGVEIVEGTHTYAPPTIFGK